MSAPPAGRHARRAEPPKSGRAHPPSGRAPACVAQAASGAPPCTGEVRGRRTSNAPSPPGDRRRTAGPCRARARCPVRRPRPRQSADLGRNCSEPNPATPASSESRLPVARALPAGRGHSGQSKAWPRFRRGKSSSTALRTHGIIHDSAGGAFAWLGSDAASGTAAQRRAAGCNRRRPQRDRAQVVSRWHSVVTQRTWFTLCCAAASHLCCAEADVPEGSSGDTDVALGMDPVPAQMWAGDGLGPGADVDGGRAQSPVEMPAGMRPGRCER